ncbi:LapA family protein [Pinisolibacter sp.]|uniref:LapA family protein n=1 Tax=Pinisolibacter sp. TaxID=2172024 RepID=UPI002FDDA6E0
MLSRLLTWLLAVPFGAVVVALSVTNRKPVTVALDPFRPEDPAFAVDVPLFALVLGAMVFGILLGGFTVWWHQRIHRRAARVGRREAARLADERDRLASDLAARNETAPAAGLALPAAGPRRVA